jgi:hypothetical protein
MSCFQCDLDIPHVCYANIADDKGWGMTDQAIGAIEAAQRHGFLLTNDQRRRLAAKRKARR